MIEFKLKTQVRLLRFGSYRSRWKIKWPPLLSWIQVAETRKIPDSIPIILNLQLSNWNYFFDGGDRKRRVEFDFEPYFQEKRFSVGFAVLQNFLRRNSKVLSDQVSESHLSHWTLEASLGDRCKSQEKKKIPETEGTARVAKYEGWSKGGESFLDDDSLITDTMQGRWCL